MLQGFMKFLSPEVALYLYKSCIKYCFHVWTGAPNYYADILDMLEKQICWTIDPTLYGFLELLDHCTNLASLNLFYWYYFGRSSYELVKLVPLTCSYGSSTCYCDNWVIFLSPFLDVIRKSISTVSFFA